MLTVRYFTVRYFTVLHLAALLFTVPLFTTAAPGLAAVDCDIVNQDLGHGRKSEDIAEHMGITVADVQDCKDRSGGAIAPGTPASSRPDTEPKAPAAPAAGSRPK